MSKSVPMLRSASVKEVTGAEEMVQDDLLESWDGSAAMAASAWCSTADVVGCVEDEGLQRATVLAAC